MKDIFINKHSIESALSQRGGGSSIEVNPIVTKGTKIAEITVDENKNEIYAPNYDDTEIKNQIENKVSKEPGKGLSTNDYSTQDKNKVDALGSISQKNMWVGTQEQYDSIKEKDANTLYFITK